MDIGTVQRVDIEQKMRSAYLSYAMSVITSRALPDVRDGLKPVQRRILYAMHDMGLRHNTATRKSARIVGEVLGKYHPHGDSAVYDAMVRMAQDFSMRYMLVDGQGNFGSIDGDGAAAIRYTEARLSAIGEEMLTDLDKDTVNFTDNFDGSLQEPEVLPAKLPNLLLNGVGGIAVGMATNIPPHNLTEIADAIAFLVDHYAKLDDVTVDDLLRYVQGPDFPTGGTILGREGIRQAYATGKGRVVVRAQAHVEDIRAGYQAIIVTELPYQVNKANLVERIADLVRDGRIEGIADLRDESDRTGMRIVIELKRGIEPAPILKQLLKQTQLQSTFSVNMLTLVNGEPRTISLKRALTHYIEHRVDVITRRTRFELERARARAHILEGLLKALDHLDEVIDTIRRSQTADTARNNLCKKFGFTEEQAQAILDMQLRRLAALERRRLQEEYAEVLKRIAYLEDLLADKQKVLALVKEDILDLKERYGDARRTRISDVDETTEFRAEDMVPDEELVLLLTGKGYVASLTVPAYEARHDEIIEAMARENDTFWSLTPGHSQDTVLFISDRGRAFGLPAHQVPEAGARGRGLPLTSLLQLGDGERIVAILPLNEKNDDRLLFMGTVQGRVKRLALSEVTLATRSPLEVMGLPDGDVLGWAMLTNGSDEVIMISEGGRSIRFQAETVRPQGRSATGMRGITLNEGERVVALDVVREKGELLVATAMGYAKRTPLTEYNTQGRGGQGALTVDVAKLESTGPVVGAQVVVVGEEVAFGTASGRMTCVPAKAIPSLGRATWGRLVTRTRRNAAVQLEDGDVVTTVARLDGAVVGASGGGSSTRSATAIDKAQPEEKPAGRRRTASKSKAGTATRKAATKKSSAAKSSEKEPTTKRQRSTRAAKSDDPGSSEAQTKPSRSRKGRATTAAAESETPAAQTEKKPAQTRRRSTAQVDEKETESPQKGGATTSRTRRRSAKVDAEQTPDEGVTEEAKPRARRTRRTVTTRAPRRTRSTRQNEES
jgi:DNA gyrase subunit A